MVEQVDYLQLMEDYICADIHTVACSEPLITAGKKLQPMESPDRSKILAGTVTPWTEAHAGMLHSCKTAPILEQFLREGPMLEQSTS